MHSPGKIRLSRGRNGNRCDTGNLSRYDIHEHTGRVDRLTAGNVESDAGDRFPALDYFGASAENGCCRLGQLCGRGFGQSGNCLVERRANFSAQPTHRSIDVIDVNPYPFRANVVQSFGLVEKCLLTAKPHLVDKLARGR